MARGFELICLAVVLQALAANEEDVLLAGLGSDDECEARGGADCALQALQLQARAEAALSQSQWQPPMLCMMRPWLCQQGYQQPNYAPQYQQPQYYQPQYQQPNYYQQPHYQDQPPTPWAPPMQPQPPQHRPSWWPSWWPAPYAPSQSSGSGSVAMSTPPPNPERLKPSDAEVLTFYMYRAQSDENYPPMNQNMGNLAGMLWYLHNEIVWHQGGRRGTFFTVPKTRLQRFKVSMRATKPLKAKNMHFGVVNTYDSGQCTGPFGCKNFDMYGNTVGCESWDPKMPNNFPHQQWDATNHYPGALWYSLPGPCPMKKAGQKSAECTKAKPGGACPAGTKSPTGESSCTYVYEAAGEITIDELEGIGKYSTFIAQGGVEYDQQTDRGKGTSFWDNKNSTAACQTRIDKANEIFRSRFPNYPDLPDPTCDFNKYTFYQNLLSGKQKV